MRLLAILCIFFSFLGVEVAQVTFRVDAKSIQEKIEKDLVDPLREKFLLLKVEQARQAARMNFRNRTYRLWRSIRQVPRGVKIGSFTAFYWRYLDNFTRGRGRWARYILFDRALNIATLQRAFKNIRR